MKRSYVALALLAGLALLAWRTLTDERLRLVTLGLLGLFAFKTWLHQRRLSRQALQRSEEPM